MISGQLYFLNICIAKRLIIYFPSDGPFCNEYFYRPNPLQYFLVPDIELENGGEEEELEDEEEVDDNVVVTEEEEEGEEEEDGEEEGDDK